MNIVTTFTVIAIMLSGIVLLTRDLSFLWTHLLKPLKELAEDMESIAQLHLAGISSSDELTDVGTKEIRLIRGTFENMKRAIKSWGKYVPWPVVHCLLKAKVEASLEVNELEVTVFFSDIASFTTIVESLRPELSLLLLSRYFNDMSKVVDDNGGVVLEFIGDALLCIFGAPLENPDHGVAAVRTSLKMLSVLERMNRWCAAKNLPQVSIRCGVHTGRVLVGNMGFESRMKYGIVGEDSHVPMTLEEMNKHYCTKILISQATHNRLKGEFRTRLIDFVRLGGDAASVEPVYEVRDCCREACELHTEAMESYRQRDFAQASQKLARVSELMRAAGQEEKASALLQLRCESYLRKPPDADWDGVWNRADDEA
jgi:adenylate cyclase